MKEIQRDILHHSLQYTNTTYMIFNITKQIGLAKISACMMTTKEDDFKNVCQTQEYINKNRKQKSN